jgi:hypothetical protein
VHEMTIGHFTPPVFPAKIEKGNACHQSMPRTLCRVQHVKRDGRMRIIVSLMVRLDPRQEPYEGKSHVRICAGGAR